MRVVLHAVLAAAATVAATLASGPPAMALGLADQCQIVTVPDLAVARYAAAVGVMSADKDVRSALLAGKPDRQAAEKCATAISLSLCQREFLKFAIDGVTSLFPGSQFYTALQAADTLENPGENSTAAALGLLGAAAGGLGGLLTGEGGLGGAMKGAVTGGGLGLSAGALLDSGRAQAACKTEQQAFTDLTAAAMRGGLGPRAGDREMAATLEQASLQATAEQKQTIQAMIEVMTVTADRIQKDHMGGM